MNINILIVGVGGQGTLLASRVLGGIAIDKGLDCKLSEVHGMSQRGGSVVTHVRIGEEVASPMITEGEADFILAFEKLEALRWCHYLKKDGVLLVNDQEIMPMPVIIGAADYPKDVYASLKNAGKSYKIVDGLKLAAEAGNTKAVNVVMLGVLTRLWGIDFDSALKSVIASVPSKLAEINKLAFSLGYNAE